MDIFTFPHAGHTYRECCWSSNFLRIFLMAPPYLVPYFPTMPTFLVLLAIDLLNIIKSTLNNFFFFKLNLIKINQNKQKQKLYEKVKKKKR